LLIKSYSLQVHPESCKVTVNTKKNTKSTNKNIDRPYLFLYDISYGFVGGNQNGVKREVVMTSENKGVIFSNGEKSIHIVRMFSEVR
jgi:hypothetical protein